MQRKRKRFFRVMTALLALWLVLPSGAIAKTIEEWRQRKKSCGRKRKNWKKKLRF
ncbi:hypothetical protein [Neglectibacter timonensis]|uniref:hypothetical protein n=1 Tax=Neglectibacter timonensis TaxID=1776382 RepID=UPI003992C686